MGRNGRRLQSFQQFQVADDKCGMKVGTVALVLGCWAGENLQGVTRILDIGTGSGILALMLAQRHKCAVVEAVELEPDAARQAAENVASSPFSARISVHEMAVQAWEGADVDLVVCNPPFSQPSQKPRTQTEFGTARRHASFARALCSGPACDPRCWGFSVCVSHGQGRGSSGHSKQGGVVAFSAHLTRLECFARAHSGPLDVGQACRP